MNRTQKIKEAGQRKEEPVSSRFVLKEPQNELDEKGNRLTDKPTLVLFVVRHRSKQLKLSTGVRIQPSKWDSSEKRITKKATLGQQAANANLQKFPELLDSFTALVWKEGSEFTLKGFKAYVQELTSSKPRRKQEENLLRFAESFIQEVNRRPETLKGYRNTLNRLTDYTKHTKQKLNFENIDLSLLNDLVRYFEEVKGFSMNTIHLHVKNLKVFMKEAMERGLHENTAHESRRFTVSTEDTPKAYLTAQELEQLRQVDLSENKRLERVRDLFLIHSSTGVRYSDLHKINSGNLKHEAGAAFFQIRQEKTSAFLWIPVLNSEVLSILDKYEGRSPGLSERGKFLSNQKYNAYLKEVAQKAEVLEQFTSYRTTGGKREEIVQYKAELVCSHTARRSFATNAYKAGLPTPSIMAITGHKSESSFRKYIQLSSKEHALELMKRANSKEQFSEFTLRKA